MVVTGAVAGAAAVAYGELVLDIRASRSSLAETHAITNGTSIHMSDYDRDIESMKQKYGPDTETALLTPPPRLVARMEGKVLEEKRIYAKFLDAKGLFVIGPYGRPGSTFPFQIDPLKAPPPGRK